MFHYYTCLEMCAKTTENTFVAEIRAGIASVAELAEAVNAALKFPAWSGKNLDALWDNFRTLDTIEERRIVLVHKDFPALDREDGIAYAGLLRDTVVHWRNHANEHTFQPWFPEGEKEKITALLHEAPLYEAED